jgi:Mg2+ and Co2+ transporter CorA
MAKLEKINVVIKSFAGKQTMANFNSIRDSRQDLVVMLDALKTLQYGIASGDYQEDQKAELGKAALSFLDDIEVDCDTIIDEIEKLESLTRRFFSK